MLSEPSAIVAQLLRDKGAAASPTAPPADWEAYAAFPQERPERCVVVRDTLGRNHGRAMFDGKVKRHWGIQILVRGAGGGGLTAKAEAFRKAVEIAETLAEDVVDEEVTIGGGVYNVHCFAAIDQPISVGFEAPTSKRWVYSLNCTAAIRRLS